MKNTVYAHLEDHYFNGIDATSTIVKFEEDIIEFKSQGLICRTDTIRIENNHNDNHIQIFVEGMEKPFMHIQKDELPHRTYKNDISKLLQHAFKGARINFSEVQDSLEELSSTMEAEY